MEATICETCGASVGPGTWPFCPHGTLSTAPGIVTDELIGGFVQENFGHEPEYFTSKKAMLKRADDLNLRQMSDGDRHRGRYAITAKTLADATALLSRGSRTADEVACDTLTTSVRVIPCRS